MTTVHAELPCSDIDLDATLRVLAMLPKDPTLRLSPGSLDRATHTPDGPGTFSARWQPGGSTVAVTAHGPGAEWLVHHAPLLLGLADLGAADFDPSGGVVRDLWRRHRGLRVPRTGTVWHDLCWLIVQQRIHRLDAAQQWGRLVRTYGDPAPGDDGLLLPPSRARLVRVPSHELHRLGIERRRADTLRAVASTNFDLDALAHMDVDEAVARLRALPGVGAWTTSSMAAITWGDPDTVIVGDSGIPSIVTWLLTERRLADDQAMLDLLEPFRPHRYRVIQLTFASGRRPPRHTSHRRRIDISRR